MYRCNDFTIDSRCYELRRNGELRHVEPQVFSLIEYLIENKDRVVSKDELIDAVWHGRIVSDSTLNSRITAARRAFDDDGQRQAVIQTVPRRGFRFVAEVDRIDVSNVVPNRSAARDAEAVGQVLPKQEVRFCTAPDGVDLAYAVAGEGYPIVKTGTWMSHLEYDWQSPIWRHLLHWLVRDYRLVRYDKRGNGLSDWDAPAFSIEDFVADLETVVDAVGLERFVLFGLSQGCAISVAYAARHPDRVAGLVLYGGYSRGWKRSGVTGLAEQKIGMLSLARIGWGQDNPAFRQLFTSQYAPDATTAQMRWYNDLQRISTSGENAFRIGMALGDIDVSEMASDIDIPAVVLHCRDDAAVPFLEGRRLARLLPNARFVALEGRNHLLLEDEPAWPRFRSEIESFLRELGI